MLQIWVPGRNALAIDFAANALGAVSGIIAAVLASLQELRAKRIASGGPR
jgi:VanZ family protein